jgi:hypothetical protein
MLTTVSAVSVTFTIGRAATSGFAPASVSRIARYAALSQLVPSVTFSMPAPTTRRLNRTNAVIRSLRLISIGSAPSGPRRRQRSSRAATAARRRPTDRSPDRIISAVPSAPATCSSMATRARVPVATASTRSAWSGSAGSTVGRSPLWILASPQTTSSRRTSLRYATYRVRPGSRMCTGATSPSAADTNSGAAIAASDSTRLSGKSCRRPPPRLMLNMRTTRRRSGLSSFTWSAASMLPTSSWCTSASASAVSTRARRNACLSSRSASTTCTSGSASICGPWLRRRLARMTVTFTRYRRTSSSTSRCASGSSPHTIR